MLICSRASQFLLISQYVRGTKWEWDCCCGWRSAASWKPPQLHRSEATVLRSTCSAASRTESAASHTVVCVASASTAAAEHRLLLCIRARLRARQSSVYTDHTELQYRCRRASLSCTTMMQIAQHKSCIKSVIAARTVMPTGHTHSACTLYYPVHCYCRQSAGGATSVPTAEPAASSSRIAHLFWQPPPATRTCRLRRDAVCCCQRGFAACWLLHSVRQAATVRHRRCCMHVSRTQQQPARRSLRHCQGSC